MISANDLYYLKRVENLEREYQKCGEKLKELENTIEEYLSTEDFTIPTLNLILYKKATVKSLKKAISLEIKRVKSEALN